MTTDDLGRALTQMERAFAAAGRKAGNETLGLPTMAQVVGVLAAWARRQADVENEASILACYIALARETVDEPASPAGLECEAALVELRCILEDGHAGRHIYGGNGFVLQGTDAEGLRFEPAPNEHRYDRCEFMAKARIAGPGDSGRAPAEAPEPAAAAEPAGAPDAVEPASPAGLECEAALVELRCILEDGHAGRHIYGGNGFVLQGTDAEGLRFEPAPNEHRYDRCEFMAKARMAGPGDSGRAPAEAAEPAAAAEPAGAPGPPERERAEAEAGTCETCSRKAFYVHMGKSYCAVCINDFDGAATPAPAGAHDPVEIVAAILADPDGNSTVIEMLDALDEAGVVFDKPPTGADVAASLTAINWKRPWEKR